MISIADFTTEWRNHRHNHLLRRYGEPEGTIIDVFICKLRKKLAGASGGDEFIETVWGRGHVLRELAAKLATLPTAA